MNGKILGIQEVKAEIWSGIRMLQNVGFRGSPHRVQSTSRVDIPLHKRRTRLTRGSAGSLTVYQKTRRTDHSHEIEQWDGWDVDE